LWHVISYYYIMYTVQKYGTPIPPVMAFGSEIFGQDMVASDASETMEALKPFCRVAAMTIKILGNDLLLDMGYEAEKGALTDVEAGFLFGFYEDVSTFVKMHADDEVPEGINSRVKVTAFSSSKETNAPAVDALVFENLDDGNIIILKDNGHDIIVIVPDGYYDNLLLLDDLADVNKSKKMSDIERRIGIGYYGNVKLATLLHGNRSVVSDRLFDLVERYTSN